MSDNIRHSVVLGFFLGILLYFLFQSVFLVLISSFVHAPFAFASVFCLYGLTQLLYTIPAGPIVWKRGATGILKGLIITTALSELLCCLPKVALPDGLGYENLFRVLIMQFIDAWSFDVRSVKKTCVQIAHPGGRWIIPFDTYNLFHREDLEQTVLDPLRREREAVHD